MFSPKNVIEIKQGLKEIKAGKKHLPIENLIHSIEEKKKQEKPSIKRKTGGGLTLFMPSQTPSLWDSESTLYDVQLDFYDFSFIHDCGAGAFGKVWLVEDISKKIVALKVLPKSFSPHELESLKLYRKYINDFTNLVQIYHVGTTDNFFYYTMEAAYSVSNEQYIPCTLSRELEVHNRFNADKSVSIANALLNGVGTLHKNDLAHRDVKPNNIIFVDGIPKLGDIGMVSNVWDMTRRGTIEFIPPNLRESYTIQSEIGLGRECDLYALGKVLYLMISGERLENFPAISHSILQDPKMKTLNQILDKACARKQKNRYKNCEEFQEELGSLIENNKSFMEMIKSLFKKPH